MAKKSERGAPAAEPERGRGLWVVPLLAILNLLLYFFISMGLITDFGLPIFWWKAGSIVFQFVLCIILIRVLITSYSSDRLSASQEFEEDISETTPKPELRGRARETLPARDSQAAPVRAAPRGPKVIEYPEEVSGGIYATTLVRVDDDRVLKLRTLLARACLLCDEQGDCWSTLSGTGKADELRFNVDCREGLQSIRLKKSGM
ncbi:MAG: hypothetical protein QXH42_08220 [Thermoplasmata archaeon]